MPTNILKSNIKKYAIYLIANKRIFVAILGAYYLTIPGVTAKGIGIILLAGQLAGFILEIPSGFVSDKIGHKKSLVLSRFCVLISTLLFLFANHIAFLILAAIFLSTGHAFHSGTGSAFMHETLRGLGKDKDYARIMGKVSSLGFVIPLVFASFIPFLVGISFKLPFLVAIIFDLVGIVAATSFVNPPVSQQEIQEIGVTNFKQVIKEGYRLKFFKYATFTGITAGLMMAIGVFRAPYQTFLSIPVIYYGIFHGAGRLLASLCLALSGKIKKYTTPNSFLGFRFLLFLILYLMLGIFTNWAIAVLIFIFINAFRWGLKQVETSYLVEIITTSRFKATLLSIHSQIDQITAAIIGFGLGLAIDHFSYRPGFLLATAAYFVILLPLYFYILKTKPNSHN